MATNNFLIPEIEKIKRSRSGVLPDRVDSRTLSFQRSAGAEVGGNGLGEESLSIQKIGNKVLDSMGVKGVKRGELLIKKDSSTVWSRGGFAKYKDWPRIVPGDAVTNASNLNEARMRAGAAQALDILWERIDSQGGKPLLFRENNTFGMVYGKGNDQPWEPAFLHQGKIYIRRSKLCMYVGSASRMKNSLVWSFKKP